MERNAQRQEACHHPLPKYCCEQCCQPCNDDEGCANAIQWTEHAPMVLLTESDTHGVNL